MDNNNNEPPANNDILRQRVLNMLQNVTNSSQDTSPSEPSEQGDDDIYDLLLHLVVSHEKLCSMVFDYINKTG